MKFEQGGIYYTVKTLGVVLKPDGRLQISQRIGQNGGADITPAEKLTFSSREEGKLWFTREDGTKVCGHPSHFDQNHAYNKGEAGSTGNKLSAAKARVARAEAEVIKAAERLAAIEGEFGTTVSAPVAAEVPAVIVSDEDRNEASALFAE